MTVKRRDFLKLLAVSLVANNASASILKSPNAIDDPFSSTSAIQEYVVECIEDLKYLIYPIKTSVNVLGYYTPGDGGGGVFERIDTKGIDDLGTVFHGSQWRRTDGVSYKHNNALVIDASKFGIIANGKNIAPNLQAAIDYCYLNAQEEKIIDFPNGTYIVDSSITLNNKICLPGQVEYPSLVTSFYRDWIEKINEKPDNEKHKSFIVYKPKQIGKSFVLDRLFNKIKT